MNNLQDTIVAISTTIGEGGIGIVRLSGKKALSIADRAFVSKDGKKPSNLKTYTIHYGHIIKNPKSKNKTKDIIDEVLLTIMRAPKSYTKEDIVEINCHGGIVPLRRVLEEIVRLGARLAEPGEFTKRAFLNGRIDLTQAEAVVDVIRAKTDVSLKVALEQLEGDFSKEINIQREKLLGILEHIEAQIDFSEEELKTVSRPNIISKIDESYKGLKEILDTKDLGILLKEGITCVICGKPNVGKSSLLNALLRRNRAIVTDIPGTTRDAIEESISIQGIPVRIVDTAGILKTRNIIDKISVDKTRTYLKKADLSIFMLDLTKSFDEKDKSILKLLDLDKTIIVANKNDLKQRLNLSKINNKIGRDIISISVLKKTNLKSVEEAISKKIWSGKVMHPEATFLTNIRHKKELNITLKNLKSATISLKKDIPLEFITVDLRGAVFHIGLIIGKSVDIDVLDRIFQNFCIGK